MENPNRTSGADDTKSFIIKIVGEWHSQLRFSY